MQQLQPLLLPLQLCQLPREPVGVPAEACRQRVQQVVRRSVQPQARVQRHAASVQQLAQ